MAAAGGGAGTGGKIRTRRYHLSSGRTPYSKSRQQGQQQQGIISRVTHTVKSIVPAWLQRYFNKEEEAAPGRSSGLDRVEDNVSDGQNEEQGQVYVQNDLPSTADNRIAPEPIRTQEDHSTNRMTLHLPDVLTRPSLHRANLNFNIMDSPALNCQPSTSSTYPTGTSNFSLVKEIKDSTSQHDDDNISTTSGFSSRASDKDIAVTKSLNAPPLWSPEADRSHNLSHNSSMNSRKPTFNLSTFGTLSPSLGNSSVLNSQLGDSPFYPGKTTYGGAAAARTSKNRSTPYQAPVRRQVKPKPANQSYGVTSSTARRILQSLEKMSSPLADARRIPSISSSSAMTSESTINDVPDSSSKRKKVEASYPPVKKLVTPKSISVATNTSLYIKPSLTPSSTASASSRRTPRIDKHKEPPNSRAIDPPAPQHTESFTYPKFSTPASNGFPLGRGGGKMMREKGAHYTTKQPDEELEAPDLPEISLPISTSALPKISFGLKTTPPPSTVSKSVFSTAQSTNSTSNPEFTFSSPIVKSTESNAQSPGSSVGFTFSVPAMKVSSFSSQTINLSARSSPVKTPAAVNSSNVKKTEEEYSGFCKPAKTLKEGSVLDILKSPGATKPFGFGFQSNGSSTASQPSSIGGAGSAFGSVQQPSAQSSSGNLFASGVQTNSTSGSSGFGSTAASSAPASTGFSTSSALPATTGSSSVLGGAAALNTAANSSTLFGSATPSVAVSNSSNVFGTAAPINTTSASSVFGASTNTSTSSSSMFGSSSASTNSSTTPFVFGQPATTASNSMFGNPNESKSTFAFSGQESQPVVTSASSAPAAATPFVFGASGQSAAPAAPSFNFTGANPSNVAGSGSSPFIFGAAPAPTAAASTVPTFGKPVSQTNAPPTFGSSSTSSSLFPNTTSQNVPAFGSLTSNVQPPVFGQQSSQPVFGSSAAPAGGSGFQFGSSNFNFTGGNSQAVFQFGAGSAPAPAQPANPAFVFNQAPAFNMGANGRTATPSAISNRKIKTARRRK
ncbi:hypothetical protein GDO81_011809 [Engystomops pustulosus]|uniref:Nucleoporin Nup153 N-terminal domain-containing protein n=2 Tax=Engystomops pustulosus TaxID=76066 RepID=A0AAV7BH79_ENGPU|nr:hypothetical protein GDO81_011809 [Engystomops pustulosus]